MPFSLALIVVNIGFGTIIVVLIVTFIVAGIGSDWLKTRMITNGYGSVICYYCGLETN